MASYSSELGDGEAVMSFDKRKVIESHPRLLEASRPRLLTSLELKRVAPAHRQKIVYLRRGAEHNCFIHRQRGIHIGEHQGGGSVRTMEQSVRRKWSRHDWIFLRHRVAELDPKVFSHLRVGLSQPLR